MVIVAIIAAAILGTASSALDAGRRARTQSVILKLHNLLMERWGDYETRRLDIHPSLTSMLDGYVQQASSPQDRADRLKLRGQVMADLRLLAVRELMKLEMPDRWSDVVNDVLTWPSPSAPVTYVLATPPALTQNYYRQLLSLQTDDIKIVQSNQGAECLYMIIMNGTGDGEARTQFTNQDIGDTDGDGAPEFLDGWGRPIQFIRWPAGFYSQSPIMSADGEKDHDPFDLYKRDYIDVVTPPVNVYPSAVQNFISTLRARNLRAKNESLPQLLAFRLVPLIYSIGPDEDADLMVAPAATTELDPYLPKYGDEKLQLGTPFDEEDDGKGWLDNIHNHLIEY